MIERSVRATRNGRALFYGIVIAAGSTFAPGVSVGAMQAETADSVDAVIDRILEAYGGADAVRAVTSLRQEGLVVTTGSQEHGSTVRIAHCPDRLSLVVQYPSRTEIRIILGLFGACQNSVKPWFRERVSPGSSEYPFGARSPGKCPVKYRTGYRRSGLVQ